jgi:hypothetical protein
MKTEFSELIYPIFKSDKNQLKRKEGRELRRDRKRERKKEE